MPDGHPACPAAAHRRLRTTRRRRAVARVALTALLMSIPAGSGLLAAGGAEPLSVSARTVAGHHDRDHDRDHECDRRGGLVSLIVHLVFGFDSHC